MKKSNFFATILFNLIWNTISSKITELSDSLKKDTDTKIKELLTPVVQKITDPNLHVSPSGMVRIRAEKTGRKDQFTVSTNISFLEPTDDFYAPLQRIYNYGANKVTRYNGTGDEYVIEDILSFDSVAWELLRSVAGIATIRINTGYELAIFKSPAADWEEILPRIEAALFEKIEPKTTVVSEENSVA